MKRAYIKSIYIAMQQLADITKRCMIERNFKRAEKCLGIAERLMVTGNASIKNAVANVFVYSVTTRIETFAREERERLFRLFPPMLRMEYLHQVNAIGA